MLARRSNCFRSKNKTIKIPAVLHASYRWLLKCMDDNKYRWVLRLCRWKHKNVWLCYIITLIPMIQSLGFPARCDIKTPLHGKRLMQKQRCTFQIFFFAPLSVYCSSKYHLHIPFQTDSYHNAVSASHLSDHSLMWWLWDYFLLKRIVSHRTGTLA